MRTSETQPTLAISQTLSASPVHEQWWSDYLNSENDRYYDLAVDRIAEILKPTQDSLVLDAGCGVGDFSIRLARKGLRVHAADFSPAVLPETRRHVSKAGMADRITVMQENLLDLTLEDNTYDYVFCWGVLMHIHDIENAVSELSRVLKPGGTLILSEANQHSAEALSMYGLKSLLRIHKEDIVNTDVGREFWAKTAAGELLTRQASIPGLTRMCEKHDLTLNRKIAGEFTELYMRLPTKVLKKMTHAFNRFWFRYVRFAPVCFSNLLFFEKRRRQ